jgi:hypothetical protein
MEKAMTRFEKVGAERLLKLADILDAADALHRENKEPRYNQEAFIHPCGTPACALGHWAAANPRRWRTDEEIGMFRWVYLRANSSDEPLEDAGQEFGISPGEASELFDHDGCGAARTGKQAAKYIRKFVERKMSCDYVAPEGPRQ